MAPSSVEPVASHRRRSRRSLVEGLRRLPSPRRSRGDERNGEARYSSTVTGRGRHQVRSHPRMGEMVKPASRRAASSAVSPGSTVVVVTASREPLRDDGDVDVDPPLAGGAVVLPEHRPREAPDVLGYVLVEVHGGMAFGCRLRAPLANRPRFAGVVSRPVGGCTPRGDPQRGEGVDERRHEPAAGRPRRIENTLLVSRS